MHCPRRAGLRALQGRKELERLVRRCQAARDAAGPWGAVGPPPLLVKVRGCFSKTCAHAGISAFEAGSSCLERLLARLVHMGFAVLLLGVSKYSLQR